MGDVSGDEGRRSQDGHRGRKVAVLAVAALALALASVVQPKVLVYLAAGAGLGALVVPAAAAVRAAPRRPRLVALFASVASAAGTAVVVLQGGGDTPLLPRTDFALAAEYTGRAVYERDADRFRVTHQLVIKPSSLEEWSEHVGEGRASTSFGEEPLSEGWRHVRGPRGVAIVSTEDVRVASPLAGRATVALEIPSAFVGDTEVVAPSGRFVVSVPPHLVTATSPPPVRHTPPFAGAEQFEVPVQWDFVDEQPVVRVEVVGRLLRNPVVFRLAGWNLWTGIQWIVGVVAAAVVARARDRLGTAVERALARTRRRPLPSGA